MYHKYAESSSECNLLKAPPKIVNSEQHKATRRPRQNQQPLHLLDSDLSSVGFCLLQHVYTLNGEVLVNNALCGVWTWLNFDLWKLCTGSWKHLHKNFLVCVMQIWVNFNDANTLNRFLTLVFDKTFTKTRACVAGTVWAGPLWRRLSGSDPDESHQILLWPGYVYRREESSETSGFIFTPVYQPDCSSDPQVTSIIRCFWSVKSTGDLELLHELTL